MEIGNIGVYRKMDDDNFSVLINAVMDSIWALDSLRITFIDAFSGKRLLFIKDDDESGQLIAWLFFTDTGYISHLYVKDLYRNQGLAQVLINKVLDLTPTARCHIEVTNLAMLNLIRSKYDVIEESKSISRSGRPLVKIEWTKKVNKIVETSQ